MTIYRWVQHYAPIFEKCCRAKLKPTNDSWRVDETYVKVKGTWIYLYRAVDSAGDTVEFMLSPSRAATAAKRFFRKALRARHTVPPRVINVDKNPAYPKAIGKLKTNQLHKGQVTGTTKADIHSQIRFVPTAFRLMA